VGGIEVGLGELVMTIEVEDDVDRLRLTETIIIIHYGFL